MLLLSLMNILSFKIISVIFGLKLILLELFVNLDYKPQCLGLMSIINFLVDHNIGWIVHGVGHIAMIS